MRLLATPLILAGALLAACAPLATGPALPGANAAVDARDGGAGVLELRLDAGRQLLAEPVPAKRADIHHVDVSLTRVTGGEAVVATASVAAAGLDRPVRFGNLRSATTYKVVARAYRGPGTGEPISQDAASTVTVTLDAAYDHPTIAALPLKLMDVGVVEAAGQLALDVQPGAVPLRGLVGLVAGSYTIGQTTGAVDGYRGAARFGQQLGGVACDPATGMVYVADSTNGVIRRVTPGGQVSTYAGTLRATAVMGALDGPAAEATFNFPYRVAVGPGGTVYVLDAGNYRVRRIAPDGTVSTLAGSSQGYADGTGAAARFVNVQGLAADAAGNVYVAETARIRKITPAGEVTTWVGSTAAGAGQTGYVDAVGTAARAGNFVAVAVAPSGDLFVADAGNQVIRKITPAAVVSTWAGIAGSGPKVDGAAGVGRFQSPTQLACAADGTIYVADGTTIRTVGPDRSIGTLAGSTSGAVDGLGGEARFESPNGLALGPGGVLWLSEPGYNTIRKVN